MVAPKAPQNRSQINLKPLTTCIFTTGLLNDQTIDINADVETLMCRWDSAMKRSFHPVKPSKKTLKGVNEEIKLLLMEEKWIRDNITENPERGMKIAKTQKLIAMRIADNITDEIENKVNTIIQADRPQSIV